MLAAEDEQITLDSVQLRDARQMCPHFEAETPGIAAL
jgi:hypothetical protein